MPGDCAVISEIGQYGDLRRRLRDLGFVPGTEIGCAYRAPMGSPTAYWIKGAVIALRKTESQCTQVTQCG